MENNCVFFPFDNCYVAMRVTINNCGSIPFKQLSNLNDRRDGVKYFNERYCAAVSRQWTIVPLLEHVVRKQSQMNDGLLF